MLLPVSLDALIYQYSALLLCSTVTIVHGHSTSRAKKTNGAQTIQWRAAFRTNKCTHLFIPPSPPRRLSTIAAFYRSASSRVHNYSSTWQNALDSFQPPMPLSLPTSACTVAVAYWMWCFGNHPGNTDLQTSQEFCSRKSPVLEIRMSLVTTACNLRSHVSCYS